MGLRWAARAGGVRFLRVEPQNRRGASYQGHGALASHRRHQGLQREHWTAAEAFQSLSKTKELSGDGKVLSAVGLAAPELLLGLLGGATAACGAFSGGRSAFLSSCEQGGAFTRT